MATLKKELREILDRYGIDPRDPDSCCEWPGSRRRGYGLVRRNGKNHNVTRYLWERANGPIPAGLDVLHDCDNPPCVNLRHLFLGTHADNMRDMVSKGRHVTPNKGLSRLTPEQLDDVVSRLVAGDRQIAIAEAFSISQSYVSKLKVARYGND